MTSQPDSPRAPDGAGAPDPARLHQAAFHALLRAGVFDDSPPGLALQVTGAFLRDWRAAGRPGLDAYAGEWAAGRDDASPGTSRA